MSSSHLPKWFFLSSMDGPQASMNTPQIPPVDLNNALSTPGTTVLSAFLRSLSFLSSIALLLAALAASKNAFPRNFWQSYCETALMKPTDTKAMQQLTSITSVD